VAIELKNVTPAFDCLAGGGYAFSDLMVLFDFQFDEGAIVELPGPLLICGPCGGHPTANLFTRHYELHYQQKKIMLGGSENKLAMLGGSENKLAGKFGCITFIPVVMEEGMSSPLP
jgi:hypothetical protein